MTGKKHSRWKTLLGVMFLLMMMHDVGIVQIIQYSLLKSKNSWKCLNLNRSSSFLVTVNLDMVA